MDVFKASQKSKSATTLTGGKEEKAAPGGAVVLTREGKPPLMSLFAMSSGGSHKVSKL